MTRTIYAVGFQYQDRDNRRAVDVDYHDWYTSSEEACKQVESRNKPLYERMAAENRHEEAKIDRLNKEQQALTNAGLRSERPLRVPYLRTEPQELWIVVEATLHEATEEGELCVG